MAFRLKLNEELDGGIHRAGDEQLDRALKGLRFSDVATGIHDTRKCIKRLRSLLRLVRAGIDKQAYQALNVSLRDAGRHLSAARDETVLRATITSLGADHPKLRVPLRKLAPSLSLVSAGTTGQGDGAERGDARRLLLDAKKAWAALVLTPNDFTPIAEGLARGLKDLELAWHESTSDDDDVYHDLRKAVQRHWRQVRLVEEGWPAYFGARAGEAKAISELLGRAQDLTLLNSHLEEHGRVALSPHEVAALGPVVGRLRAELREVARLRAARLLVEAPRGFARRATGYWGTATSIARAEKARDAAHSGRHSAGPASKKPRA